LKLNKKKNKEVLKLLKLYIKIKGIRKELYKRELKKNGL
jgi:hypothetical protein